MNLMASSADLVMLYLRLKPPIPLYVLSACCWLTQIDRSPASYLLFGALTSTFVLMASA
jgi:NADH:ubiquinone oxidoreductase subunit 2 (subunit N)